MTNLVWVFFVDAGQSEGCEPLGSLDVKLACVLGIRTHSEQQEHGTDVFHRLTVHRKREQGTQS
jgi:hypothetical protein